ncbi:MAG: plasmid stabilization protein [Alphaproteobacteria bacterium]|nr:plasmid stabilization protein [Alphaproteobacteria bacterium]
MASITIRNLDEPVKKRLHIRAPGHGRTMEEAREILRQAVGSTPPARDLGRSIYERFAAIGGVELDLPPREPMRDPPAFRTMRQA